MGRSSFLVQVVRASQKAARDAERARIRNARAQARYAAEASREARRAWIEDMQDDAGSQTEEIQEQLHEIDNILIATLKKDDYFNLEKLRKNVAHPEFMSKHYTPEAEPVYELPEPKPEFKQPLSLSIFGWVLPGGTKEKIQKRAESSHQVKLDEWEASVNSLNATNAKIREGWLAREEQRVKNLAEDEKNYRAECLAHEIEIQKANAELDELIQGLPKGKKQAVETYVELVLSESDYPGELEPEYEVEFDELNRELTVNLKLHHPLAIPDTASFRFQKSTGEIVEKKQTQKEVRARYEGYVGNSVLRTIHEILEADRDGVVRLVSFSAYVEHVSPGTGQMTKATLVQVATDRDKFMAINLNNVVALETLGHLGAALSKNMFALTPVPAGKSVRKT
jgi:restriction system protein